MGSYTTGSRNNEMEMSTKAMLSFMYARNLNFTFFQNAHCCTNIAYMDMVVLYMSQLCKVQILKGYWYSITWLLNFQEADDGGKQ